MQAEHIKDLLDIPISLIHFAQAVHQNKGQCVIVGGTIRDILRTIPPKDLDIEVHGITPQVLEAILQKHARFKSVGKSFTVWKCRFEGIKDDIDISIPCNMHGEPVPDIGFEQAAERRDFRMNAIGFNIHSQTILDPLNGVQDIQDRIIRMTGPEQLLHDPLRFFRAVQFAARFEMTIEDAILDLAPKADFSSLSSERVRGELEKLFLKSINAGIGIQYAVVLGLFESYFPELVAAQWKTEAEAFNRLNELTTAVRAEHIHLYWALLLIKTPDEKITATLHRLGITSNKASMIHQLCQHWRHVTQPISEKELKHLADVLCIDDLCRLALAYCPHLADEIQHTQNLAAALNILHGPLPPLIEGGSLFSLGYRGSQIRDILLFVREAQLNMQIQTADQAFALIQSSFPLHQP